MSLEDQHEITHIGSATYFNLLNLIVEGAGYGTLLLGISIAGYSLSSKSWNYSRFIFTACLAVIFVCFSLEIIAGMALDLIGDKLALIQTFPESQGGIAGQAIKANSKVYLVNQMAAWSSATIYVISDTIVTWRAWVLFPESKLVKFSLGASMLANIGLSIVGCISTDANVVKNSERGIQSVLLNSISNILSLAVNLYATGLIAWKAWNYHRALATTDSHRRTSIQKILLLFIESGALLGMIQLFALVIQLVEIYDVTPVSTGVTQFFGTSLNICFIAGAWYPIAVVILINLDSSPVVEINDTQTLRSTREF